MRVFVPVEDEIPPGVKLVPYRIGMGLLAYTIEPPGVAERTAAVAAPRSQRTDETPRVAPLAA
jgi:hypothetical protein